MDKTKDQLYLTMLVRPLRRLAEAAGQSLSEDLSSLTSHAEQSFLPLIQKAEALSFGDNEYPDKGYHITKDSRMRCLLEQIKTREDTLDYFQPMMPVALSTSFFPVKEKGSGEEMGKIWGKVKENLDNLQRTDIRVLAENILNILFRYTGTVPSSTQSLDVSLYDQARIAASICIGLYDLQVSKEEHEDSEFRLIGGDFSGIQKYIYQIVSKYAGKNLKGRSFYLGLLSDAVVRTLLKELSLYRANIIYNSGGCFYLLAANTERVKEKLNETIAEIENAIFKAHGTDLYVAIDSVALSASEVANRGGKRTLSNIWQELFAKRDRRKNARYSAALLSDYDQFFVPQKVDGTKRDVITGEDFVEGEEAVSFINGTYISALNNDQIKIGKALMTADILAVTNKPIDFLKDKANVCPAQLGVYYYLTRESDFTANIDAVHKQGGNLTLILLNGKDFKGDYVLEKYMTYNICSMQFYGGNRFNGNTYEEMCDNEGFSRLGVLRMDVDNLGSIFQGGIPETKASLSRFAALSRSFDYFFSGYLNVICAEYERDARSFIVYSGGDDVFIVGSWDTTIDIAHLIQDDFHRYTCFNPAFSISGGIAILGAKFPIIAGAAESAEEEERAKGHECAGDKKDSISFFSMPLNWKKEYSTVKKLKDHIAELLYSDSLPKSFLSKIMEHAMNAGFKNHKISNYQIYWHLAYDLKRMEERYKSSKETLSLLDKCINEVCHTNGQLDGREITSFYNSLELWAFACRWAELEYRTENN